MNTLCAAAWDLFWLPHVCVRACVDVNVCLCTCVFGRVVDQLTAMGFAVDDVKRALAAKAGNVEQAMEMLLEGM